jgi:hypothetical protein
MAKCGHVGCGKEMGTECHGHLCVPLYRSRLSCEELSEFLYEWALAHPDEALKALADSGTSWAIRQKREQQMARIEMWGRLSWYGRWRYKIRVAKEFFRRLSWPAQTL